MRWWLGVILATVLAGPAHADPVRQPLAEAGGWSTIEQIPAPAAAPDACLVVQTEAAVGIRSTAHAVDFMMANSHWDLPAGMQGTIHVMTRTGTFAFPVTSHSSNTAAALVAPMALSALLNAMTQGPRIQAELFPGMPVIVPLAGFVTVLPAFRHCAGLT